MEQLLHYVWKHKLFPLGEMKTTDGLTVEVIDPGLHNRNSGPDFFNAKVKINGTLWVGNVEIHDKSSDWFLHGHDRDTAYDNVVLHVTGLADADVTTAAGQFIPQMVLQVPDSPTCRGSPSTHGWLPCRRSDWSRRPRPSSNGLSA